MRSVGEVRRRAKRHAAPQRWLDDDRQRVLAIGADAGFAEQMILIRMGIADRSRISWPQAHRMSHRLSETVLSPLRPTQGSRDVRRCRVSVQSRAG